MEPEYVVELFEEGEPKKTYSTRGDAVSVGGPDDCEIQITASEPTRSFTVVLSEDESEAFVKDFTDKVMRKARFLLGQMHELQLGGRRFQVRVLRQSDPSPPPPAGVAIAVSPEHETAAGGGEAMTLDPPKRKTTAIFDSARYVIDLHSVSGRTLSSVFGDENIEAYLIADRLWDFVTTNGLIVKFEEPTDDPEGDNLAWTLPYEIPDDSDPNLPRTPRPDVSSFGEDFISFRSVESTTIGEVFGEGETRFSEMRAKIWAFVEERQLYLHVPPT